jgi:hypothetical protein
VTFPYDSERRVAIRPDLAPGRFRVDVMTANAPDQATSLGRYMPLLGAEERALEYVDTQEHLHITYQQVEWQERAPANLNLPNFGI